MGKILKNGISYAGGGAEGKSAYQTWLDLGNTGTEQDFLDSLGGNSITDFYYKTLPTEPLVFSQGMVSIRKDEATGLAYEYIDESSTNRLKTDEYIHCNDLDTVINVPSEYALMTRTYTKDDDGNMVALTNIPEFNGSRTIKDIIYCRLTAPNALATQEEVLEHYRQNNLYFRFCLKRLDNADFTPETNEVVVLKYTEEANKDALKSYVMSEDYLYNSIYYDYNRQIKNMTADDELNVFIESIVNKPDFDGTLVLPRKTYKISRVITIDTSKFKVFDGNNSEFIMQKDVSAFEIIGSLDSSMSANPNTLNTEIMDNEPNTIIRNCIIRGKTNEDGTYANNGIGITLSGAIKTKIENCYIHHMATGIKLINACRDISICNNHIYAITGNGISLENTNIHQLNINSNFISYCMNCVYVKPTELANLQMNGNDIEISTYPDGYENARCLNFDISSTSNSCYEIEICGNTIQGHSASGNLIQFLGGTNPIQNVSIVGNHISNSNGTAMLLKDCKGFTIQGNTIKCIVGYIYDLQGTVSYVNIQGNTGCENCNNVIDAPASAVLEHIAYIDNITTGSATSVLTTQKTDVVIQLETSNGGGNVYTSLAELGLTADATFQDAVDALPKGGSALLGVTEFTNYQTIFPYEEGNDQFARVYIVKGAADGSRMYARWFRKDGIKEAIAKFNINDNKFDGWRMLKDSQTYTSLKELGLDTTATINDIINAMKDGSQITYKTDVFDYATEYNNIQLGTVVIHKQSASRVQALMTDKDTGSLYVGRLDGNNKVIGWRKIITEVSDPYSCTKYTALTGTEDLFTLPCGHYVSANINTTYNYPITDTNTTAHIYVLGHLNEPANNKGYRTILYFDNKNRMYRINEWWGVFTDNGWQEVAYRTYTTLAELGLTADATIENVIKALPIGGRAIISTHEFTNYQTLFPYSAEEDKYATLKVEKGYDNTGSRTIVTWVRKDASKIAYGGLDATNAVRWWNEYATKSYVDSKTGGTDVAQTDITINTNWATQETRADCPTNKYVVKNGICYLSATFTTLADKNYSATMADLATGLPKPAIGCFANVASGSNKNALVYIHNDGVLKGSSLSTSTLYNVSLAYPVAE